MSLSDLFLPDDAGSQMAHIISLVAKRPVIRNIYHLGQKNVRSSICWKHVRKVLEVVSFQRYTVGISNTG